MVPAKFRCFILLLLFFLAGFQSGAQVQPLPLTVLADSMKICPKPVLLLISTDWCKYCHLQKKQLQSNSDFQAHAASFYFVDFNAETKQPLEFNGNTYHYKPTGIGTGIHELVLVLANQEEGIAYPAWVLLDPNLRVVFRHNGLLAPAALQEVFNAVKIMRLH